MAKVLISPGKYVQGAGEMKKLGEEIGVAIRCQHEDIFNKMHRI